MGEIQNKLVSIAAGLLVGLSFGGCGSANPDEKFPTDEPLKAFPTAYGAGSNASGGRGGNVYHVSSLLDPVDNEGNVVLTEGTFRWAVAQPRPATILFDVSGVIKINDWISINGEDLTIAGQSAPQGGITISSVENHRIRLAGNNSNNMIIRYLRFKPVSESGDDSFEIFNNDSARDVIIDHSEVAYGGDEGFSIRGRETYNITFQRSILAENKTGSLFGDSDQENRWSHSLSWLNNLSFNNSHRSPNITTDGRFDIINNVTHNWEDHLGALYGSFEGNIINNYLSLGERSTVNGTGERKEGWSLDDNNGYDPRLYVAGNYADKNQLTDPDVDNWFMIWRWFNNCENCYRLDQADTQYQVGTPFKQLGHEMPIQSAIDAYNDVITNVGANAYLNADGSVGYYTDVPTTEYLEVVATEGDFIQYDQFDQHKPYEYNPTFETYKQYIVDSDGTPINTRPADFYGSNPHIPEAWFQANVPEGQDHNDLAPTGYTWLEEYLNRVDRAGFTQ